jgi:hypothetical protein
MSKGESSTTIRQLTNRWWIGLLIGAGAAVIGLYGMRYPYQTWFRAASNQDVVDHRLAMLFLLLVGVGVVLVVVASRRNVLIAAVPALVWLAVFGPFMFRLNFPEWSPDWISGWVLASYGAHVPVIIGAVVTAALWNGSATLRRSRLE